MLYRIVHAQKERGNLLLTDIESGLPNAPFNAKQSVYVPYYHKYFGTDGLVIEDRTTPGYVELVASNKARASVETGVIKGLADGGHLTVIEVPTGGFGAPTISSATFDNVTDGGAGTNEVEITGTGFLSFAPDATIIIVTNGSAPVNLTTAQIEADTGSDILDTTITVSETLHGFGTTAGAVTEVTVTANGQDVTETVTGV